MTLKSYLNLNVTEPVVALHLVFKFEGKKSPDLQLEVHPVYFAFILEVQ